MPDIQSVYDNRKHSIFYDWKFYFNKKKKNYACTENDRN